MTQLRKVRLQVTDIARGRSVCQTTVMPPALPERVRRAATSATMKLNRVRGCARCGRDHEALDLHRFARPFAPPESGGLAWSHWATCPTSGDPILVMQTDAAGVPSPTQVEAREWAEAGAIVCGLLGVDG